MRTTRNDDPRVLNRSAPHANKQLLAEREVFVDVLERAVAGEVIVHQEVSERHLGWEKRTEIGRGGFGVVYKCADSPSTAILISIAGAACS